MRNISNFAQPIGKKWFSFFTYINIRNIYLTILANKIVHKSLITKTFNYDMQSRIKLESRSNAYLNAAGNFNGQQVLVICLATHTGNE